MSAAWSLCSFLQYLVAAIPSHSFALMLPMLGLFKNTCPILHVIPTLATPGHTHRILCPNHKTNFRSLLFKCGSGFIFFTLWLQWGSWFANADVGRSGQGDGGFITLIHISHKIIKQRSYRITKAKKVCNFFVTHPCMLGLLFSESSKREN